MTVFMVGDPKQAIYRFRRGEARVFDAAAEFLHAHFGAERFTQNMTRRLAPALVKASFISPEVMASVVFMSETPPEAAATMADVATPSWGLPKRPSLKSWSPKVM